MRYSRTDHIFDNQVLYSLKVKGVTIEGVKLVISECQRYDAADGTPVGEYLDGTLNLSTVVRYQYYFAGASGDIQLSQDLQVSTKAAEVSVEFERDAKSGSAKFEQYSFEFGEYFPAKSVFKKYFAVVSGASANPDRLAKEDSVFYFIRATKGATLLYQGYVKTQAISFEMRDSQVDLDRKELISGTVVTETIQAYRIRFQVQHPANLLAKKTVIDQVSDRVNLSVSSGVMRSSGNGFLDYLLNRAQMTALEAAKILEVSTLFGWSADWLNEASQLAEAGLLGLVTSPVRFEGLGQLGIARRQVVAAPLGAEERYELLDVSAAFIDYRNFLLSDAYGDGRTKSFAPGTDDDGEFRSKGTEPTRGLRNAREGDFQGDKEEEYSLLKKKYAIDVIKAWAASCEFYLSFEDFPIGENFGIRFVLRRRYRSDAQHVITIDRTLLDENNYTQVGSIIRRTAEFRNDDSVAADIVTKEVYGAGAEREDDAPYNSFFEARRYRTEETSEIRASYTASDKREVESLFSSALPEEKLLAAAPTASLTQFDAVRITRSTIPSGVPVSEFQPFLAAQERAHLQNRLLAYNYIFSYSQGFVNPIRTEAVAQSVHPFLFFVRIGSETTFHDTYADALLEYERRISLVRKSSASSVELQDLTLAEIAALKEHSEVRTNELNEDGSDALEHYVILSAKKDIPACSATLTVERVKPPFGVVQTDTIDLYAIFNDAVFRERLGVQLKRFYAPFDAALDLWSTASGSHLRTDKYSWFPSLFGRPGNAQFFTNAQTLSVFKRDGGKYIDVSAGGAAVNSNFFTVNALLAGLDPAGIYDIVAATGAAKKTLPLTVYGGFLRIKRRESYLALSPTFVETQLKVYLRTRYRINGECIILQESSEPVTGNNGEYRARFLRIYALRDRIRIVRYYKVRFGSGGERIDYAIEDFKYVDAADGFSKPVTLEVVGLAETWRPDFDDFQNGGSDPGVVAQQFYVYADGVPLTPLLIPRQVINANLALYTSGQGSTLEEYRYDTNEFQSGIWFYSENDATEIHVDFVKVAQFQSGSWVPLWDVSLNDAFGYKGIINPAFGGVVDQVDSPTGEPKLFKEKSEITSMGDPLGEVSLRPHFDFGKF